MKRVPLFLILLLILPLLALGCPSDDPEDDDPPPLVPPTGPPGTFVTVGSLATARHSHAAASLPNGDVLVTGGVDGTGGVLASAELYEYLKGSFSGTGGLPGGMTHARQGHVMTALGNGSILITGGENSTGPVAQAEIYIPSAHTFTVLPTPMIYPRSGHRAVLLDSGNVFIAGGVGAGGTVYAFAEIYDWSTQTFTKVTANMLSARKNFSCSKITGDRVLVAGGIDGSDNVLSSAEIFDPGSGSPVNGGFSALEAMPGPRADHVVLDIHIGAGQDQVVLAGGRHLLSPPSWLSTAVLYHPDKYGTGLPGFVALARTLGTARTGGTATAISGGYAFLLVGGGCPNLPERFDPYANGFIVAQDGEFFRTQDSGGSPTIMTGVTSSRSSHTASYLPNGTVLLVGGLDGSFTTASAEVYTP